MRRFYIETDKGTRYNRNLAYYFTERENGVTSLEFIKDHKTNEVISIKELEASDPTWLLSIATLPNAGYNRVYLD